MKRFFQRLTASFAAVLSFATAADARAPEAHPAVWEVSDADTTIYLFGTIHLLPAGYQWRTAKFDQIVNGSQQLVVETVVDQKNPGKMMAALASVGFADGLPPLASRVPAARLPALKAAIANSGMPPAAFDRMKTWTAAFVLLGNQFRSLGLKGADGVETVLRDQFMSQGKTVGELESNVEQLGYFDALPESAQLALLEGSLQPANGAMNRQFSAMLKAWGAGDVPGIARTFDTDLEASPALKKILIERRNANWSRWIEKRLDQPGSVVVAVGAGHLAGKQSVVAMLKRDGYRVRRVQ